MVVFLVPFLVVNLTGALSGHDRNCMPGCLHSSRQVHKVEKHVLVGDHPKIIISCSYFNMKLYSPPPPTDACLKSLVTVSTIGGNSFAVHSKGALTENYSYCDETAADEGTTPGTWIQKHSSLDPTKVLVWTSSAPVHLT